MSRFQRVRRAAVLAAAVTLMPVLALMQPAPAVAANWLELNFWLSGPRYDAQIPICDSGWVLHDIRWNFRTKEGRFWNSDLSICRDRRHQAGGVPPGGGSDSAAPLVHRQGFGVRRQVAPGETLHR